jgi:opacity protein-like surface antigen
MSAIKINRSRFISQTLKKDTIIFLQVVFWALLFLCQPSFAQKIEIGGGVGGFNYRGDISPTFRLRFFKPGGSLFFRYNPNQALSLRAEVAGGLIGAKDAQSKDPFQQARNMSFRTTLMEGSVVSEYNFLNYLDKRFVVNWTPYVFGGLGYTAFKPNVQTADYKTSSFVIPYGVGVKYQIKRPWSVGLEYGTRKTFTDYLDNLGGEPVSNVKLEQGDPSLKDTYFYVRLSVSYTFYKIFCP